MPLTDTEVRNAEKRGKDYKLADSAGLYLFVTGKGAKSWRFKYRFAGKEKRLTFGLYPEVKLKEARDRRDEARAILRSGFDPAVEIERRKQDAIAAAGTTFKLVAEDWIKDESPRWSEAHAKRVRFRLENDIYPGIGALPISEITGRAVLNELRKIEKRGSIETAKRVRGYVLAIFKRAKGEHLIKREAVTEIEDIGAALKPTPPGSKQPALVKVPELIDLQRDVDRSTSDAQTKLCSRLIALTVVRIGVLRTATWGEFSGIDWEDPDAPTPGALWEIPAARMKLEVEDKGNAAFGHDVPLSHQAVQCLRALRVINGRWDLLFPGALNRREPMSDSAVSTMYKRIRAGYYKGRMVPHGWRSAFSTIMNERAAERERDGDRMIIDMMLAHVPEGMSASEWAYNRARYQKPRRELGRAWADLITEGWQDPFELIG
ncbi:MULTISPECIES: tyrosine-type recombinase/integrase [unclassified Sphingomonas]|uniref:tyrosine-type recombinase/integrase n=1 Tax=unclassified Sphingomonas TaxID=196159 RepID=UPI0006F5B60D|nr:MULTISPECIES: integrase arm-type DNA-binding domain-containing protein [unclassified Sphingomonas]KQX18116.1 integrase [Sphingomonas sp. Root1294]KQY72671.1 integrase [Sphingomonas sp. Root50]KRB87702.1 integrase [Sphingomonas sp. Root720]